MSNSFDGTEVSRYEYRYDDLGRRENVENSGSAFAAAAFTKWTYDERNQIDTSSRQLGTLAAPGTSVPGETRDYDFDPIGNRTTAVGQDGLASIAYGAGTAGNSANELNQYATITTGGVLSWVDHDDDGNMTAEVTDTDGSGTRDAPPTDATKTLTYNGENRLVGFSDGATTTSYVHDYIGRRVSKAVAGGATTTFVYDGWNMIREDVDADGAGPSTPVASHHVWGLDLSQSMQGAGGIGGLVAVVDGTGAASLFAFDGNGNVSEVVAASTGSVAAHYEYDAFGNVVTPVVGAAAVNPWRFSTKYVDGESGYSYYGFRYLHGTMGRWTRRDPAEELGGENLFAYALNAPSDLVDPLGEWVSYRLGSEREPHVEFRREFPFDPLATPTMADRLAWVEFGILNAGALHLLDARRLYSHYRSARGTDQTVDYRKAYRQDSGIRYAVNKAIEAAQREAERWAFLGASQGSSDSSFEMVSGAQVGLGGPSTENWQKSLGGHHLWGFARVGHCGRDFKMKLRIHELDFYEFNVGSRDIATGRPDDVNGRFAVLGWAKPFITRGVVTFNVKWTKGDIRALGEASFEGLEPQPPLVLEDGRPPGPP